MPILKVQVDPDILKKLTERALANERPIPWEARAVLRNALGGQVRDDSGAAKQGAGA